MDPVTLAAIGGFIATYGSLIVSVASIAYAIFFAPDASVPDQRTEGPRIGELQVTTSTYGKDYPIVFGTFRFGGNIIYATPIEERKEETVRTIDVGGKGGGESYKHTTVGYTYWGHFAIAFAEGPAAENGLVRVWADGKLIWDRRAGKKTSKKYPDMDIRFYRGTKTQLPDPFIEAQLGVGEVPAHRDLVYVVIQDMPLVDVGNRPPNFTAEISFNAAALNPTTVLGNYALGFTGLAYDPTDERAYFHRRYANGGAIAVDLKEDVIDATRAIADFQTNAGQLTDGCCVSQDGYPVYMFNDSPVNDDRGFILNAYSLETESQAKGGQVGVDRSWNDATLVNKMFKVGLGRFAVGVSNNGINLLNLSAEINVGPFASWQDHDYFPTGVFYRGYACVTDKDGEVWAVGSDPTVGPPNGRVWHIGVRSVVPNVARLEFVESWDVSANIHQPSFVCYDAATHSLMIGTRQGFAPNVLTILRWDIETEAVLWQITDADVTGNLINDGAKYLFKYGPETGRFYSYDGQYLYQIRISDGEVLQTYDLDDWGVTRNLLQIFYQRSSHSIICHDSGAGGSYDIMRLWLDRANTGPIPLDEVLLDLATRTGLEASDIDVSSITASGDAVRGYAISKQSTVRAAIEPLGFAYFFDAIESDNKVKFVKRGGAPALTIPEDDLGAAVGGDRATRAQLIIEELAMEAELPRRVELRFRDAEKDYDQGMEYETRLSHPVADKTQGSNETQSVELPMSLLASEARAIVESVLYQVWTNRNGYEFKTMPKYQLLEPTDVINVTKGSNTYTMKLISTGLGAGYLCDMAGAHDDAETYLFSGLGTDSGLGHHTQTIFAYGRSRLYLLDTPILRDIDDPGALNGILYIAVGTNTETWRGALVQKSADGSKFEQLDVPWNQAAWGHSRVKPGGGAFDNALEPFYRWTTWDRVSELNVRMVDGADLLVSITELECLNGGNAAVLGNEIIKFATVAGPDSDGVYTLTDLIRARRGTGQWAEAGHSRGERFVLLSASTISRVSTPLEDIGEARYYRSISSGAIIDDATIVDLTYTAACLKPYSVSHLTGTRDGSDNIDLVWVRRTRVGGAIDWNDTITEVPLGEEIEQYEVDYYGQLTFGSTSAGSTASTLRHIGGFTAFSNDDLAGRRIAVEIAGSGPRLQIRTITEKVDNNTVSISVDWELTPGAGEAYGVANADAARTEVETSESGQYSAAEQTSDLGAPAVGDPVYAVVYQMSEAVGRGFASDVWVF